MTTLKFADTHNMVAFLAKPTENEGFKQIVDFLNAHTIKCALTINPTIYTSYIEQFWAIVKVKTINGEVQLQALVDERKIIITESIVRRDLQLEDAEGVDCLPNVTIFEQLTLMGRSKRKNTEVPQASGPTTNVVDEAVNEEMDDSLVMAATTTSGLEAEQDSGNIDKTQSKATLNEPTSSATSSGSGPRRQETMGDIIAQTRSENVSKLSNDPLLARGNTLQSGEDRLKLEGLMSLCTTLQSRVLALATTKTTQATKIASLKKRVKKLKRRNKSRTHRLKRLYRVGSSGRVESSEDEGLGEEDASKQGRIADIDANEDIYLVNVRTDEDIFGVNDLDGDEVIVESVDVVKTAEETRSVVEEVTAITIPVSAATTTTTTIVITDVEMTLAQELAELKSAKPKSTIITTTPTLTITPTTITAVRTRPRAKSIVIHEQEQAPTPTVSSQQPSQVKVRDKGKGKMVEPEPVKKMSKKELLRLDEELTFKLQDKEEEEEEESLAREKAQQLAQRLQAQEQDELTDEEKTRLFVQFLEQRRKHFAAKRAEEKRNRPPTRAQQRSIMCTYLKNMEGWKPKSLKNKSFANIQELFDKAMKRVNTFVDYRTKLVEESSKKAEAEIALNRSLKRAGEEPKQKSSKKQKVDDDKETTELKSLMEVNPDEEEVALDAIPLAVKSLSIVAWKIHKEGKKSYYQIIRADRSSNMYLMFSHMLKSFDREDLETLYKLVKAKYGSTRPVDDLDLVLYGDLKTMFEPHVEDNVWKNQSDYSVLDWKLYDSCGVHSLRKQNVHIHMLVEKRYPLTAPTITDMLNKKLQWRIVGIKRLIDDLRVTTAQVCVTTAKLNQITKVDHPVGIFVNHIRSLFECDFVSLDSRLQSKKSAGYTLGSTKKADNVKILQSCNETGNWSLCMDHFNYFSFDHFDNAIYWNDALHWLGNENRQLTHYRLNIEDHEHPIITTIQIPQQGMNFLASYGYIDPMLILIKIPHLLHLEGKLFESRGCLLLVCRDDIGSSGFTIYDMMKGFYVWSVRYHVDTDEFMNSLPEGWLIRSTIWSIILREREDDSFLVISLSVKVIQYNLISQTLYEIYDCGSNQLDDSHDNDNDDDEILH
ncbi:hypothetical protein Tco_1310424 [Tanacetum coccineum]